MKIRNSYTILLLVFAALTISSVSAYAMGEKPILPDKQQQEAIVEFQENEKYQKQPVCNEPLIVTISNMQLSLPRTPLVTYITKEKKTYRHMDHRCEIKKLDNVSSILWPNMTLYDASGIIETDFHKYVATKIEASQKDRAPIILQDGIEQMNMSGSIIFAVPVNLISTYDKKKALFNCSVGEHGEFLGSSNCTTNYLFKNNLGLSYRYFGSKNKLQDMIIVDKQKRAIIEKYITAK